VYAPIIPFLSNSSAGCAITDAVIAVWFFANAPSIFDIAKIARNIKSKFNIASVFPGGG
jgi:hypothetical protein